MRSHFNRCFLLLLPGLFVPFQPECLAQPPNQAAVLRGEGAFLRGLGSYNLNTAQADSINLDTVIRWKQDLRNDQRLHKDLQERNAMGKKLKIEEVKRQQQMRERTLRINPTPSDIQNGQALNALLYDLTDPGISSSDWSSRQVSMPKGLSVKDLIFRFTPLSGTSDTSKALSRGVIALSRLDVEGNKWPTIMKQDELERVRHEYEVAYAQLRDQLIGGKPIHKGLSELDHSLDALKAKVETAVPKERGFRDEALKYVKDLNDATRMFDATTVDYSREILVDTKDHDATTVGELVGFMLKYRLQFATAESSATGRVLYGQVYEVMRQQVKAFDIQAPAPVPESELKVPADAVTFRGKRYKAYKEVLTWHEAKMKCEAAGGHLAIVLSKEENDFIRSLGDRAGLNGVWLGATDDQKEGDWVWVDGTRMKYNNWVADQPNNRMNAEHFLVLVIHFPDQKFVGWCDEPDKAAGNLRPGYACQWD
jgi:hypothetical protein